MKPNRRILLAVVTVALAVTGSGTWWGLRSGESRAASGDPTPQVVNAVTGDAFAIAADGSLPSGTLPASQAVAAFELQDPAFNPPTPVKIQAGFFFPGLGQPDGPAGRPVYALTWHECPVSHDPTVVGPIDGGTCTRWLFLDANTGDMIVAEYQIPPGANAATVKGCNPKAGAAIRTLRLGAPGPTVTAHLGDTIKVIAHRKGSRVTPPDPLNHKRDVCRISQHRVSASTVIAKFQGLRAGKIQFGSVATRGGHFPLIFGYARIKH